jgi:hypothetical protein
MANRAVKFEFTPEENEQIEATIIVPQETRSVIHGVVKDYKNCIIKNAVVKLFKVVKHYKRCILKPIGHTFTDESGEFLFGPLSSKVNYVIKVWINDIKIKELVVKPDVDDFCYKDNDSSDTYIDCGDVKKDKHIKKDKYMKRDEHIKKHKHIRKDKRMKKDEHMKKSKECNGHHRSHYHHKKHH